MSHATSGAWVSLSLAPWSREGFTPTAWNTEPNGTGTSYDLGLALSSEDQEAALNGKDLYLQWNQNTYDIFYLSNGSMIIENIGYLNIDAPSENNSISGSFFDYLNLTEGYRIYMTLSLFGGKYIFDDILDGGTNGIEAVPAWNRSDGSGKVYDLNGRALKSTPTSGIYIRNGKKFVVK